MQFSPLVQFRLREILTRSPISIDDIYKTECNFRELLKCDESNEEALKVTTSTLKSINGFSTNISTLVSAMKAVIKVCKKLFDQL